MAAAVLASTIRDPVVLPGFIRIQEAPVPPPEPPIPTSVRIGGHATSIVLG